MHSIIYSLRDQNGSPILDYKLGLKIVIENTQTITVELPTETITLNKSDWVNKMRVYDNGNVFFIICTKHISSEYAFETLIKYAVSKLDKRIDHLNTLKETYKRLTAA